MSLSIVIPSKNPESGFFGRVRNLSLAKKDWEIIIIDDASEVEIASFLKGRDNLKIIRNVEARGAGACRNIGGGHVTRDYTMFLDDDDYILCDVIDDVLSNLEKNKAIDFSLASYNVVLDGETRPAWNNDQEIIDTLLKGSEGTIISQDNISSLLRFTNYPWNKIYRTSFVRRCGIRFSETFVQNDIYAHWQSILSANRIYVTSRVQCTKVENSKGARIGNTNDARRVEAFAALRETYELVLRRNSLSVQNEFWAFYASLIKWMLSVSSFSAAPQLLREHVRFASMIPPDVLDIEKISGIKRWEIWDMNDIATFGQGDAGHIDSSHKAAPRVLDADLQICMVEISRLNKLAAELMAENERIRHWAAELDREKSHLLNERDWLNHNHFELQRKLNSKAGRIAMAIRRLFVS